MANVVNFEVTCYNIKPDEEFPMRENEQML